MNHRQNCEHHALVTCSQIIQKLFHFTLLLLHVIRDGGREIVVLILLALPVRDIRLNTKQAILRFLDRFVSRNRHNIN